MKKKTNKTTISNLHYNLKLIAFSLTLGSAVFKMNSFESLANTNDTVISFEKETMYISENTYNSQYVEDIEVIALKESDEALINKLDYVYEYGYDAATDTKINTDFTITKNNKTYENLSGDDYRLFVAVVAAESSKDFHDALAVASSILNRCDDETWINYLDSCGSDGRNPISHITFSGQYGVYHSGAYKYYLEQKNVPKDVEDACRTVWYHGIRNNKWTNFLGSNASDYSDNQVVEGGNRFNNKLEKPEEDKTIIEKLAEPINEVTEDVKQKIK